MKVGEVLGITEDCTKVAILDREDHQLLAFYDGKDSIPKEYNLFHVWQIATNSQAVLLLYI